MASIGDRVMTDEQAANLRKLFEMEVFQLCSLIRNFGCETFMQENGPLAPMGVEGEEFYEVRFAIKFPKT